MTIKHHTVRIQGNTILASLVNPNLVVSVALHTQREREDNYIKTLDNSNLNMHGTQRIFERP